MSSFFLAREYLRKNLFQTIAMVGGFTFALYLPIATHWLLFAFEEAIVARAASTPVLVGAKGSRFDLLLHGLYFRNIQMEEFKFSTFKELRDSGPSSAVPFFNSFSAKGHPVVGTSELYFKVRNLRLVEGENLSLPGECLLGSSVARKLGLSPGDKLRTDRENPFDLSGEYPLLLNVKGVLAPSESADDDVVFVSLKTSWIISGVWHGHDADHDLPADSKLIKKHLEVTAENLSSFHSHTDSADFPLTAMAVFPENEKSTALLLGRYADHKELQAIRSIRVVDEMLGIVAKVREFLDANHALVLAVTLLLVFMISTLSLRLRAMEMETFFLLGCSRGKILSIRFAELSIVFASSILPAVCSAWITILAMKDYLNSLTA